MKKIISILLVLTTIMSCFVLTVSAEETVVSDEGRLPFEDVKDGHWFAEAVELCYANDVINGMSEYTFGWNGQLTRAQFVTMLCNLEGVDTSEYNVTKFTDVKSSHWYYGAVAWAYENGIVNGMTETTFVPNGVLTRAQLSVVMNNYMKDKYTVELNENALDSFSDKPKSQYWYYDAMVYAVSAGLISGMSNGTLVATGNVTRAQAAVIFKNFMEKYYFGSCEHNLSEVTCTEAAVCEVCGMVNGLPNGHILTAYDCVTGGICTVCNTEVSPSTLLHDYVPATCTEPRTCRRCLDTQGSAKGHSYKAATCTTAKQCSICNITEGEPLGHTTSNGVCVYCNKGIFPSNYDKVRYYLMTRGQYDKETDCYSASLVSGNTTTAVECYGYSDRINIKNVYVYENSHKDESEIRVDRYSHVYTYVYRYVGSECEVFVGEGMLDSHTYNRSFKEGFGICIGDFYPVYTERVNIAIQKMLADANVILKDLYGGSIRDLDFKAF